MPRIIDIVGVGAIEFPDDMDDAAIIDAIENDLIPNAGNPDPTLVADRPDLFPDIDRGSFFGGLGSGAERLGRVPEAVGAGVFRSQEELDDLKAQMAEENNQQRYRATLDDVTGQWDKGNYLQAAGTLFGDVLPQTLGESLPAMGVVSAGAVGGAKLGALAGTAGGPLAPVTAPIGALVGGIAGGVLAGLPNFFGMNVERQIEANEITDPDQIETVKATAAAAAQSGLEYLTLRAFNLIPGADKIGQTAVSKLVGDGVKKLGTKDGLKIASKAATRGGLTEAATEVGQQGLERLQAGLDVGNPEAIKEYIEAAVLGGLLGVSIGGTVTGGMDIRSTKKGIDETYRMLAVRNEEYKARQRQEAEDMAIYTGAIPDPDAPLLIEARPELVQNIVLSPVNGDPIESGTDEVQDFVNQSEAEFIDRNIERQINEAMDPEATGKTKDQKKTYQDLQVAKEALTGEFYDLDALSETAPNIAQAVLQTEAGRGDYTVDKTEFTIEELEQEGKVRGVDPEVAAEELQALRATRRPVTEMLANIRESDVIQAAQDKNIKTGTKSFDGLVKYITGANNLKEASPFRLNLMKEAMENIQAPFKSDQPIDLLDIREQNYEYNDFTEAVKKTLNNKNKSGKPVYNHSKLKVELPHLSNEGLIEIRDEMQRIGLIRKQGKKYIVDNELIRDEFVPPNQPIPDAQIVTAPDREVAFQAEPLPDGRFRVVARKAESDPSETGEILPTDVPFERTISIHDTPQSAEASIEQYQNAPENSTDVDLRGIAVMPTSREYDQWQAELRQQKYNTDVVNNIKTSLKNEGERRGLQKAGISVEVVESLGAVGEGTIEGKYADGVITLALDAATVDADSSDVESARIDKIMKNLASVLSHEQIHALKEMGQISDSDYSLLVRQAAIKKRPNSRLNTTNNPNWTYLDDAKASHAGVRNTKGEPLTQEELEEEAIAEMFRDWSNDPSTITGKPASIFRRILKFITTLGGFLQAQNVRSVNDIFTDIQRGDFTTTAEVDKANAGIMDEKVSFSIAPPANIPKNTVKAYKLLKIDPRKPGELFAPYVDAKTPIPQGVWMDAQDGGFTVINEKGVPYILAKTGDEVPVTLKLARFMKKEGLISTIPPKRKDSPSARKKGTVGKRLVRAVKKRPGWHLADIPVATHIGSGPANNRRRRPNEVWAEVEIPADVDWQAEANSRATMLKDGITPDVRTADINDQVPIGGYYRYKTQPSMAGDWMIAGGMKINKVLSDAEAQAIRDESGIVDVKTGEIAKDPPRDGPPFDGKFSLAQPYSFTIEVKGKPEEVRFASGLTAAVNRPANPMQRAFANGYMNIMSGQQKNKFASFGKGEYYKAGQEEARLAKPEATQVEIPGEIQRYAVDAIRPGKPTITRYIQAKSLQDAQAQVSKSLSAAGNLTGYLGQGASELTNLRLDDPATAQGNIIDSVVPKNKRYAVDAVRPNQSTVTRYFFAKDDEDAQNVAASPSANQGASELTNLRLDDPDVAQDMEAPKFSIRRWRRVLDLDEYKDAVRPVPISPLRRNPNWGENTRGLAWLDKTEPLEIVLLRGIDIRGDGFGRDHILAKADRFGGRQIMGEKLRAMLANSSDPNSPNHRIKPYKSKEPIFDRKGLVETKDDYQMTWRDPEDGQIYVLGLEKYSSNNVRQAAITTFYPQDRIDQMDMGRLASEDDVAQYMAERDASRARYSISPNKRVQQADTALASGNFELSEEEMPVSAVSILYNPEFKKMKKQTVKKASAFLMERSKLDYAQYTPANVLEIGRIMAREALHAIKRDGNAATWYRDKVAGAHEVAGMMFPELKTNKAALSAFNFILAVTSNGSTVSENSANAISVYKEFRDYLPNGRFGNSPPGVDQFLYKMPIKGFGAETPAMKHAFKTWNLNVQEYGIDRFLRFLETDWKVGDLKKAGWDVSGELVDTVMPGSVIFGSKIGGGFFSNLEGRFDNLTMDLWFMRTWGRLTGSLILDQSPETAKKQRDEFRKTLEDVSAEDLQNMGLDISDIVGETNQLNTLPENKLLELADKMRRLDAGLGHPREAALLEIWEQGASAYAPMRIQPKKQAGLLEKFAKKGIDIQQAAKLIPVLQKGKTLAGAQGDILKQPAGGSHRKFMREATQAGLDMLQENGIDLELADMQALIWYPEKDLWTKLGVGNVRSAPTDYEIELSEIAKKEGFTDDQIERAIQAGTVGGGPRGDRANDARGDRNIGRADVGVREDIPTRLRESDRQGREVATKFSIVKMAPPTNSAAFAEYTKDVAPAFKNPDGSPKPLFTGTQHVFDEWAMNHSTDATFASESPAFAEYWAKEFADDINPDAPASITVETATGQKVTIPQNEPLRMSDFSEAELEADAEMMGTTLVIPLYSGAKKVWDFENPADLQAAREFLEKYSSDPSKPSLGNSIESIMAGLRKGDWMDVEDDVFIQNFLKPNYDGFSIVEGNKWANRGEKNWGFFNKEDLKSVFNPEFDRTDAKFSVAPTKSFEEEVYERLTEREVTGLKALVNKAKKLYKQQLLPGGLLPDEISELKIYRDNNFNIAEDTVARTLTSMNNSLKKAYGKRWYERMTPEQNQEIDRFLHGDNTVRLPEPVKVAVMKMRQDIDNLSKDYVAILQNDIIQMTASGDPEAAARAKALQDVIIGNQGKYVTRSYKAFDDPYWSRNVPPDVVNNATRYIMAENGGDVDATETLMAVLLKGEKSAYGGMESLIKEGTLGARDLSILVKRKEIAPEIRALLGEYTDPKINYTRTMLKMSRLIWNTNFLKDVQKVGMREGWLTAEQNRDNTDAMAGTGSEVLAPLNGLYTTPEVKQAFKDALGKSSAPNWMNHLIGLNGVVKAGKVLYSPATQIRNFVSAPFFVIQSGSMNINEIQKAATTAWEFAVSKDGNTTEYFRELTRLGVTYNTPNVGMLQDALADGEQVFAALNQVGVNKFGERADQVVTAGKKVNNIIQNFYRIGDDFWKIVAYESQLDQYRKAKPNMPLEEVKKIVAKRVRDSIPTYSLIGSGMRKLSRFPVVGTFVAFSSEVIRTSVGNVKIMASDFADPDLKPLARKRAIGMAIAHSWTGAAGALSMSLLGITDDEEESIRKLGSPWAENADILFWGRDEKGNMQTVDLSFVDPYNLFHKPITALTRSQPWGDSLIGAAKEVLLPFFGFEIGTGALYEVITNRKMRTDKPIYNEDAPGLDQSEQIGLHLIKSLGPGVFRNIEGVNKAIKGERSTSGKEYKLKDELLASMGIKFSTFDPKLSLYFRSADFKDTLGNANTILYQVASNVNQVDDGDLEQAFNSANEVRIKGYTDMLKMVNAAKLSGVSDSELRRILSASRISKAYINRLVRGREAPKWRIGKTFLKGATKRAKILLDRETAQDLRRRRNMVRGIARDQQ